uniref:VWFA domain-containing protein n=1 Tax=Phasianus colchicus TaxID=9054 RepID=A0A669PT78_PHACC
MRGQFLWIFLLGNGHREFLCSSATVADIVFLVDESSKIGSKNFQLIRAFLLKVVNALDIAPSNVRVGLVLYSNEPRLEFTLDTFKDKLEILNYLKNLPYRGGQPYTGLAIEFLRNKVFTQEAGSRKKQGVQQIAVVITDGQSLDDYTEPASKLRRESITVYAVGIKNITEGSKLDKIATYPPRNHVTTLKFFLQLSNIAWKIKKQLCNEIVTKTFVVPLQSQSLKKDLPCLGPSPTYSCPFGEVCDRKLLLLLLEQISNLPHAQVNVILLRNLQVNSNNVRFGVVQYASESKTEIIIGQHNQMMRLTEAIENIDQIGGGTRTGNALSSMKTLFKMAYRDNVPQILIVITDGKSEDGVNQTARDLRQQGINIYAIGIKDAVQQELEEIAGTKNKMFFVNDFDSLKHIKREIVSEIREEFQLDRYSTIADVRRAIQEIQQIKLGTLTGKALTFAASYFDPPRGGRPELKQYLIVITDGEAQDSVKNPARAIRDKGITIYAINLLQANNSQLVEITGTQDKVFFESEMNFLEKQILFEICNLQKCK